jgi:hypothetical protein
VKPLVIIHGWSDEAESFLPLANAIEAASGRKVDTIYLGNYVSLDDDVQMLDLVEALDRAWQDQKLSRSSKAVDLIVHSTGALVTRDWIQRKFVEKGSKPPINNFVMLAPANFGSPLAHKGRAIYGRVVKGFNAEKRFETGTQILKALEMASPYTWQLAEQDRFAGRTYSESGIRTTVIVGNTGYRGISSLANEHGSDGTVYVSTANMNCAKLEIRFPAGTRQPSVSRVKSSRGDTAFLVMDKFDHGSIAYKGKNDRLKSELLKAVLAALKVENAADFRRWVKKCKLDTDALLTDSKVQAKRHKQGYQNTVFRVRDDRGFDVTDYVVEFYSDVAKGASDSTSEAFYGEVLEKVHAYKDNASLRSFMINCNRLLVQKFHDLRISLSAVPDLGEKQNLVGYRSFDNDGIGYLQLDKSSLEELFQPNRTLFVDVVLTREQKNELFRIKPLTEMTD